MKPVESAALALSSVLPLRAARCLLERALRHAGLDPATTPAEQVGAVLRGPVFEAVRQVVPVTETRLWEVATRMVPPELLPTVHQQPARQAEPAAAAPAPAPTMAPPPPGEPEAPIPDELWHRFLPFSRRPTPQVAEFSELARALEERQVERLQALPRLEALVRAIEEYHQDWQAQAQVLRRYQGRLGELPLGGRRPFQERLEALEARHEAYELAAGELLVLEEEWRRAATPQPEPEPERAPASIVPLYQGEILLSQVVKSGEGSAPLEALLESVARLGRPSELRIEGSRANLLLRAAGTSAYHLFIHRNRPFWDPQEPAPAEEGERV